MPLWQSRSARPPTPSRAAEPAGLQCSPPRSESRWPWWPLWEVDGRHAGGHLLPTTATRDFAKFGHEFGGRWLCWRPPRQQPRCRRIPPPPPLPLSLVAGGAKHKLRVSVLSARILRIETPPFDDRPSITFAGPRLHRLARAARRLLADTGELLLRYDGSADLSCPHLNVTVQAPGPGGGGPGGPAQVWCPDGRAGDWMYPGTDPRGGAIPGGYEPTAPGQKLDTWQDTTRGPAGSLDGNLDTMDCYVMAEGCRGGCAGGPNAEGRAGRSSTTRTARVGPQ